MTNILRLAGKTKAYFTSRYDGLQLKHDILQYTYNYPYVPDTPPTPSFPAAWGYWKFEEESGDRIDATGNDRNFIPFTFDGLGDPSRATGKIGYGIRCDYLDTYPDRQQLVSSLIGGDLDSWTPGEIGSSISLWVKAHATNFTSMMVLYIYGNYEIKMHYDNISKYKLVITNTTETLIETDYIYDQDTWYFLIIINDAGGFYLYVDNVLAGSYLGELVITKTTGMTIISGFENGCYGFVDEYGIWDNTVLTADQRAQLYNNGNGWSPY
jgi:hypothetical protein